MRKPGGRRRGSAVASSVLLALVLCSVAHAQDRADIEALRAEVEELRRKDAEKQRQIDELRRALERLTPAVVADQPARPAATAREPAPVRAADTPATALDRAVGALTSEPPGTTDRAAPASLFARRIGGAEMRLVDLSMDVLFATGGSSVPEGDIRRLNAGAHDPRRRGFTLQQTEISLTGAVDPYFTAEAHVIAVPDGVELEEAFFTTTSLPHGLQLEGGYFFTEFGRLNPRHPHAWDWIDQPVINSRILGPEGLRSPGVRLGWLTPLPWFSELHAGAQNANEGELTQSFISEEGIGGRPPVKSTVDNIGDLLYLARWNNAWNVRDDLTGLLGVSGLFGPNATGRDARTYVYGLDMTWKWQPAENFRGWPFLTWQSEVMKRDFTAAPFVGGTAVGSEGGGGHGHDEDEEEEEGEFTEDIRGDTLRDWGLYTQLLWGFRYGWAAGLRYEYASGSGESLDEGGRAADFLRDDRHRVSPLIVWHPTEFSRLRLQYDYDHADFLRGGDAHSVWFGMEVLYGAHPAHQY